MRLKARALLAAVGRCDGQARGEGGAGGAQPALVDDSIAWGAGTQGMKRML